MNPRISLVVTAIFAAALLAASWTVRGGLESIATAIREKPLPGLPEKIVISELTVEHAAVQLPEGDKTATPNLDVIIKIDKLDLGGPNAPRPAQNEQAE